MKKKKQTTLSADTILSILHGAMEKLDKGKISAQDANAMATQSREICRIKRLQFDVYKAIGETKGAEIKRIML